MKLRIRKRSIAAGAIGLVLSATAANAAANAAEAAKAQGAELCVVKLAEAKKGFVLLPKRWVVER